MTRSSCPRRRRPVLGAAYSPSLLPLLAVLACGGGTPGAAPPSPVGGTAAVAVPVTPAPAPPTANPADVHFMQGMIHHHGQALDMVALIPDRTENPRIRAMGERMRVSQADEIRLMQQWLRDHGEEAPEPSPLGMRMVHGGMEHHMLMAGMLTPEQMAQLEAARGIDFDRLFLRLMIQHHEGAIVMVEELFASPGAANDTFIYKMASDIFADQGTEIDRMQRMLEELEGGGG